MAHSEKYGKYWYVRYKDESGQWKRKACASKRTAAMRTIYQMSIQLGVAGLIIFFYCPATRSEATQG